VLAFNLLGRLVVYGLQRLQNYLPLNPQARRVSPTRRSTPPELRHQHQLAGLRRREHDELSHADGGADGAELRLPRPASRPAAADPRVRTSEGRHARQLLVDFTRTTLYILLPLSISSHWRSCLRACANLLAYHTVPLVESIEYDNPKARRCGPARQG
jgi:K+-transporting ATPase ATPase A chain